MTLGSVLKHGIKMETSHNHKSLHMHTYTYYLGNKYCNSFSLWEVGFETEFWPFHCEIFNLHRIFFKSNLSLEFSVNLFRNGRRKSKNVAFWKPWKSHIFFAAHLQYLAGSKDYTKIAWRSDITRGQGVARQLVWSQSNWKF